MILRAADRNMAPYPATAAVFRAEFNIEVPVGTRFSCQDLNFRVTARMDAERDTETGLSHPGYLRNPRLGGKRVQRHPDSLSMCRAL